MLTDLRLVVTVHKDCGRGESSKLTIQEDVTDVRLRFQAIYTPQDGNLVGFGSELLTQPAAFSASRTSIANSIISVHSTLNKVSVPLRSCVQLLGLENPKSIDLSRPFSVILKEGGAGHRIMYSIPLQGCRLGTIF